MKKELVEFQTALNALIESEIKHMVLSKEPQCFVCKKPFVNAIDSITKKVSKYLWKPSCDCAGKNVRISMG